MSLFTRLQAAAAALRGQSSKGIAPYVITENGVRSFATDFERALRQQFRLDESGLSQAITMGVAAWVCMQKQGKYVQSIPLQVVAKDGTPLEQSPAHSFLENASELMFTIEAHLRIFGQVYLRKLRNTSGFPSAVEVINPARIAPVYDLKTQHVRHYTIDGDRTPIPVEDIIYGSTFSPSDTRGGVSSLRIALTTIKTEADMRQWSANFFSNSAIPPLIIGLKGATQDEAAFVKAAMKKMHQGVKNAHRVHVTNAEITSQELGQDPDKLAMSELDMLVTRDTCNAFQIHPVLAGYATSKDPLSAKNTQDFLEQSHITDFVIPEVEWILRLLNNQWLKVDFPEPLYRLVIDHTAIQSRSFATKDRTEVANANLEAGQWTINEAREHTGRAVIEDPHIERNPDWILNSWQGGVLFFNEARAQMGLSPVAEMDGKLIFDMQPAPAFGVPALSAPTAPTTARQLNTPIQPLMLSDGSKVSAQLKELSQWKKKVFRSGDPNVEFETYEIPAPISGWLHTTLGEYWNPESLFDGAHIWIRTDEPPDETDLFGATPEATLEYWQHYDALAVDLGSAWLDYMRLHATEVRDAVLNTPNPNVAIASILAQGHDSLVDTLIGDEREQGALTALVLAGMGAGNEAMINNLPADPTSPKNVQLTVDWELMTQDALAFARAYARNLVSSLDASTENMIQNIAQAWLESGESDLSVLENNLLQALPLTDDESDAVRRRSELIATTESLIAYNEGAFNRWGRAGVTHAYFQTVRDSHVCPICRPLHGQRSPINEGWTSPYDGKTYRASVHPRCRCFRRPDMSNIDLDAIGEFLNG